MRTSLCLLVMFLFVLSPVAAVQLTYSETEKVALNISAADPDKDSLKITYSAPLNEQGEWKTSYGDAGVYAINITVSDGTLSTSEQALLIINRKEEAPALTTQRPRIALISVKEGKDLQFSAKADDPNQDALTYTWQVDNKNVSQGERFTYAAQYTDQGNHTISVHISDGKLTTIRSWNLMVRDVDLNKEILGMYNDITVNEGQVVRIPLPDTTFYKVQYSISSPLEKGLWKTSFESAGLYRINIHVFGRGFDAKKTIRVRVLNVDRPPVIQTIPAQVAYEGKSLSFVIKAHDPDGDLFALRLNNIPVGAVFVNNTFSWNVGFDEVQPGGISSGISRNFHLLNTVRELEFVAISNNKSASQKAHVTIFNTNRAPKLAATTQLSFKEGELFVFEGNATDPDNDHLDFSYDSTLKRNEIISFDQQGNHVLKVTVSDGFLQETGFVPIVIENTNRLPMLNMKMVQAKENRTLSLPLQAKDEDNDPLTYQLMQAPPGMTLEEKTLTWTPGFGVAKKNAPAVLIATIGISDGKSLSYHNLTINVEDINARPVLLEAPSQSLHIQRGKPLMLAMNATDPDGDALSYTWRFGLFDSHQGGELHARTFVTSGSKEVRVIASDGQSKIEKKFQITVV